MRDNFDLFETLFGWTWRDYDLEFENRNRIVEVNLVTGNYFPALGIRPAIGRLLLPEDDRTGAAQGIVLSHRLWRDFFGADERVLGNRVKLLQETFEVVGVAPPEFLGIELGSPPDAYIPYHALWRFDPEHTSGEGAMSFFTMGRVKGDVPLPAAQTMLRERWRSLEGARQATSGYNNDQYVLLRDGSRGYTPLRAEFSQALYALTGLVAAVFLIACANLASLLIVRGIERTGKTTVRLAMGANRGQLILHWMTECHLIACLGGATGLVLAPWIAEVFLLFVKESDRAWLRFEPEPTVVALAVGLTLVAAFLFGLLPAFRAHRLGIQGLLKEHSGAVIGHRGRLAHTILAMQVAIALVLVVSAGLFTKTLWKLSHTPAGLATESVAYAWPQFWKTEFPRDRVRPMIDEVIERLRNSPNIASVSEGYGLPFAYGADAWSSVRVSNYGLAPGEENLAFHNSIAPGYLKTLGIPIKKGRDFEKRDQLEDAPPVVIVNERFARHYFPDRDPIGQEFRSGRAPTPKRIIGVVGDTTDRNFREQPREFVYRPVGTQSYSPIVVRTKPGFDASLGEEEIRALLSSLAPNIPIESGTLKAAVRESLRRDQLVAQLSSSFGVLGMLLAAVGLYSATAHIARSRRREIGLRVALGAERSDVVRLLLRENVWVTLAGLAIGLAGSVGVGHVMESLLFGVSATDPLALGTASALLALVALAASLWPAFRAAKLDPSRTLRYE